MTPLQPNTFHTVLEIADTLAVQTKGKNDLSTVFIKSFEDSRNCLIEKGETTWLSRLFETLRSIFSGKKVVAYNLKDNLLFLQEIIKTSKIPEDISIDSETRAIEQIHNFVDTLHRLIPKKRATELQSLIAMIDTQTEELITKLQNDISSKSPPLVKIEPVVIKQQEEPKELTEFRALMEQAHVGISIKGEKLDKLINTLSEYASNPNDKEMRQLVKKQLGVLQLYRAITSQERILSTIKAKQPPEQVYEITQRVQKNLLQLASTVEEKFPQIRQIEGFPKESEQLIQDCQQLLSLAMLKLKNCEDIEKKARLKLYQKNDVRHFDSINEKIANAQSFVELNALLTVLKAEVFHIQDKKLSSYTKEKIQDRVYTALKTVVERSIKLSGEKRIELTHFLEGLKRQPPSEDTLIKAIASLKEYELAIPLIETWLDSALDDASKQQLRQEISIAKSFIRQANSLLEGHFQQMKEEVKSTSQPAAKQQFTGPISASPGSIAVGNLEVHPGGTVQVINYTGTDNQALQRVTSNAQIGANLGLLNFSDIASLASFANNVPQSVLTSLKTSQAAFSTFAYIFPLIQPFKFVLDSGYSVTAGLAFIGVGTIVLPVILQKAVPKQYQKYLPYISPLTQVAYFAYAPSCLRMLQTHYTLLTKPVAVDTSAPIAPVNTSEPAVSVNTTQPPIVTAPVPSPSWLSFAVASADATMETIYSWTGSGTKERA